MRTSLVVTIVAAMLLATSVHAQQADANKLKDRLTGDAKGAASANPQCKLFTQAEAAAYAGAPLGPAENAAGGSGCMWSDKNGDASVMVQVVPASYFTEPKLVKGFKRLPDVGTRGWVAPDDGWSAGALVKTDGIVVGISGRKATEASAVALLKEVIKRRAK